MTEQPVHVGPTSRLEAYLAVAILVATLVTVAAVGQVGRASRAEPPAEARPLTVTRTSGELLEALRATGARGAVLVSMSRFLHFVPVEGAVPREAAVFPVRTFDLHRAHAAQVSARNVLWLALESGVVREVFHLLPPDEYQLRRASLERNEPGIWVRHDRIVTHENGSRRTISDHLPTGKPPSPALLVVDASYLEGNHPAESDAELWGETVFDRVILSRSEDNPDVSDEARRGLDALAQRFTEDWR